MNAPVDRANAQVSDLSHQPLASSELAVRETAPAADDKICWIEVRQAPYPPNQQVELLHLQAEAEALLLQLQAMHQRRHSLVEAAVDTP